MIKIYHYFLWMIAYKKLGVQWPEFRVMKKFDAGHKLDSKEEKLLNDMENRELGLTG